MASPSPACQPEFRVLTRKDTPPFFTLPIHNIRLYLNVVRCLAKREQASWRQRLQRAYNRPTYTEALGALETLHRELEDRNQSAAGRLAEGLDETLTLHRLGLYGVLGRSLKTTNCLESINALVEERCAKVDHWQNSSQRHRWLATALLDIEPRLRKVMGYRPCPRSGRAEARTQDQHDDVEEESRVMNQEPSRVSTKNGGSSQRSVQFWSVSMANKSSIVSDLHGCRTPSVSGEELQAPGKSGPQ